MKENLDYFNEFLFRHEIGGWFMKPVCDFFGLDYDNQVQKINKDKICQTDTGKFLFEQLFGDKRARLTLQDRGFARWVQMTNPSNIRGEVRVKFEIFQANIFDYLWKGNTTKTAQLEDLREFNTNIDKAYRLKTELRAYIAEQNKFKKLCLDTSPQRWAELRGTLRQYKLFPVDESQNMLTLAAYSTYNLEELKHLRKKFKNNIAKNSKQLHYQSRIVQQVENPMPKGYKRALIEKKVKKWETELLDIEERIMQFEQIEKQGREAKS